MTETRDIDAAFDALLGYLSVTTQPWWIIGGAAMVVLGHETGPISDIDVVLGAPDGPLLCAHFGFQNHADSESERFRSSVMIKCRAGAFDVEMYSGFEVKQQGAWHPVLPQTRQTVAWQGKALFVPDPKELADIFELCGRPKDLARAQILRN